MARNPVRSRRLLDLFHCMGGVVIRALFLTAWQHDRTALLVPVFMIALPLVGAMLLEIGQ